MKNYEILQNDTCTMKVRCEHGDVKTGCSPVGVLRVATENRKLRMYVCMSVMLRRFSTDKIFVHKEVDCYD